MEDMVVDTSFWSGRKVLVTGHTGFKGAWLAMWLNEMGSEVTGLSFEPDTTPNLWSMLAIDDQVKSYVGDIRDPEIVTKVLEVEPEIVFHFAAQSLVRKSYRDPVETFSTNVVGTVNLLHEIAKSAAVRAVVVATSDKVYENHEDGKPFVESDRLGGADPYSASKSACEIAVRAMRESFFSDDSVGLATVRAGNVIGGGDWSADRLVPDIIRGCLTGDGVVTLRAPESIRPWQHVLEPLSGYLKLAQRLFNEPGIYSSEYNFGPASIEELNVRGVADGIISCLKKGRLHCEYNEEALKESIVLRVDTGLASTLLDWQPAFDIGETLSLTAQWYAEWHRGANVCRLTASQIKTYQQRMAAK